MDTITKNNINNTEILANQHMDEVLDMLFLIADNMDENNIKEKLIKGILVIIIEKIDFINHKEHYEK